MHAAATSETRVTVNPRQFTPRSLVKLRTPQGLLLLHMTQTTPEPVPAVPLVVHLYLIHKNSWLPQL